MNKNAVLAELPQSTGNPLLGLEEFRKLCEKRFRDLRRKAQFEDWIDPWEKADVIRPVYVDEETGTRLYSSFQVWQISVLWPHEVFDVEANAERFRKFERVLQVLIEVQDFYLPLVRTDRRTGEQSNYESYALTGGFMMRQTSRVLLSSVQRTREWALSSGRIVPTEILKRAGISAEELREWANYLVIQTKFWDPLQEWRLLLSFMSYPMRQKLRWKALLAEDHYLIASMVWAFLEDLDPEAMKGAIWQGDMLPPVGSEVREEWLQRWYGNSLDKPFEMLDYLANQYNLNPKPRAIVFTEGDEWEALAALYEYYQYTPSILGIEFRSIGGEGNFKLRKYQAFIEYMHEKQVLIYFVLDNEGKTSLEAERLLKADRQARQVGLKKVIPAKNRIKIWKRSFEEDNFTDAQIARCLRLQGHEVSSSDVAAVREDEERKKALVSALVAEKPMKLNKRRLAEDLVADLVAARRRRPGVKKLRPVERFVKASGEVIMLNHQPALEETRRRNLESGFMG